jgi:hypothetical protein
MFLTILKKWIRRGFGLRLRWITKGFQGMDNAYDNSIQRRLRRRLSESEFLGNNPAGARFGEVVGVSAVVVGGAAASVFAATSAPVAALTAAVTSSAAATRRPPGTVGNWLEREMYKKRRRAALVEGVATLQILGRTAGAYVGAGAEAGGRWAAERVRDLVENR